MVHRYQDMAGTRSEANHLFPSFRSIYNHARRTCDLTECPKMAIEWFEEKPDGRIIDDLQEWRQTIDDLPNLILLLSHISGTIFGGKDNRSSQNRGAGEPVEAGPRRSNAFADDKERSEFRSADPATAP